MIQHPEVAQLIEKFKNKQLHAAHSGRELMRVLVQVATDSRAETVVTLSEDIKRAIEAILPNLPAYAPPLNVMHKVMTIVEQAISSGTNVAELRSLLVTGGERYYLWSMESRKKISGYVFNIIPDNADVFTFTLSETVSNSLLYVWGRGKRFSVFVTESRPNNDGLETASRLSAIGIPVTYGLDVCIDEFVSKSDLVISGTEAVLDDGSAVCKVGTRLVALVANQYQKPFYVLVDTMKFNVSSRVGVSLPLDPITKSDLGLEGNDLKVDIGGHLFDKTPNTLIHSMITEKGVISPQSCAEIMNQMGLSQELVDMIHKAQESNTASR